MSADRCCDVCGQEVIVLIHERIPGVEPATYVKRCRGCADAAKRRPV